MPRTALTPRPFTMEVERSPRQQLHDFILRFAHRFGLNSIHDLQTIEDKPVRTFETPREDHPVFRPACLKPALQC